MSKPVTHAQLKQALAPLATKQKVESKVAKLATKKELQQLVELKKKLGLLATKKELAESVAALRAEMATLRAESPTKAHLEILVGVMVREMNRLEARMEARMEARFAAVDARFAAVDGRFAAVDARFAAVDGRFDRLDQDLARHVNAVLEEMRTMIGAIDDKYADLPARVSRLESRTA